MSDTMGSIIGLLGVIVGWFFNRLTIRSTIKNQEFYKAAAAFRVAFTDEICTFRSALHPENMDDSFVKSTLTNAFVKHYKAYIAFRPYLSKRKQYRFDEAWKDFCCPEGGDTAELPSLFIDYLLSATTSWTEICCMTQLL